MSRPVDSVLELHPAVRFDPAFAARAEAIAARMWRRRAARECAGAAWSTALGDDLVGVRAYRAGDDPRAIDWTASARSKGPVVRVTRAARGGFDVIAIDASLSMAIGPPGKLQRAAEVAAALALFSVRGGAAVTVVAPPSKLRCVLRAPPGFRALLAALETLRAADRVDWNRAQFPRCDRATWIGDLAGASPDRIARAASAGTALVVVQLLAPHEIDPQIECAAVLVDPESGDRLAVDAGSVAAHALAAQHRRTEVAAELGRRRARFVPASSSEPFEAVFERILRA